MKVYYYKSGSNVEIRVGKLEGNIFVSITGYKFTVNPKDYAYVREYKG